MAIINEVVLDSSEYGDAVQLEEYNGTYSLIAAQKSKSNDKVYARWSFPQGKDKQPMSKAMPTKVKLGNKAEAIGILAEMIVSLKGVGADNGNDDIPF